MDRLRKTAPSPELERPALVQARAHYAQMKQEKDDRNKAGAAKASARHKEREQHLAKLQEQCSTSRTTPSQHK